MASVVEEIEYEGLENGSIGINMLAGAMAGISEHAVMYPVDSIKVSNTIILSFHLPCRLFISSFSFRDSFAYSTK
jgi:hypothetical protein